MVIWPKDCPRISIITSLYKGEEFIEGFFESIVQQTVFDQCELIIINANSPENEEEIIKKYMQQYPNIRYARLSFDPGIYGVWNMAIQAARGEFITNANVDDRLARDCYEVHMKTLDENPDVDLTYSAMYFTRKPHETFETHKPQEILNYPEFSVSNMRYCLPGYNPMWRKSMHNKHGFFDDSFETAGDHEMWCRAVKNGSVFKKAPGVHCLYYNNPKGLSTDDARWEKIKKEIIRVGMMYYKMWDEAKHEEKRDQ